MKRIVSFAIGAVLCALAGAASAAGEKPAVAFLETFDRPDALSPALGALSKQWVVSGGVLQMTPQAGSMPTFDLGDATWADTEIEFRVRVRREKANDTHFGLFLRRGEGGSLQLYCRKDQAYLLETDGRAALRHVALGYLRSPLDVGEGAAFHTFRVLCRGLEVKVWMDGVFVGKAASLVPAVGMTRFYAYNVDVALDDLSVVVLRTASPGEAGAPRSPNLAPNSSFEYTTEPGLADYWGCPHWGIMDPYWVTHFDEWRQHFGVDDRAAFEGRRSMRIVNPDDQPVGSGLQLRSCLAGTRQKVPHVLSAYLKSEPAGVRVKLGGVGRQQEFTLTGEWQRYHVPFLNEKGLYEDTVNVCVQSKGTVWIDAVQLEEGDAPTAYAPSAIDRQLAAAGEPASGGDGRPQVAPSVVATPPVLDGRLDEPCWKGAARVTLKGLFGGEPSEPTTVRLLQADGGLYLGIECQEKRAAENRCRVTGRDGQVWNDPSIELFLSPRRDDAYYHLAVNQAGARYDAANDDVSWDVPWQAAAHTRPGAWTAEVSLPFGAFAAAASGNTLWGLNIGRNNPGGQETSVWSPTYGGFHKPDRFGAVRVGRQALDAYRLSIQDVRILRDGSKAHSLSLRLRNGTAKGGDFLLQTAVTACGRSIEGRQAVRLGAASAQAVSLPMPGLASAAEALCEVRLSDRHGGTLRGYYRDRVRVPVTVAPDLLPQFRTYTTETELRVRVRQEGGGAGKAALAVSVEEAQTGKPMGRCECRAADDWVVVSFDVRGWPNCEYLIRCRPVGDGASANERTARVTKAPPTAHEVKIDRFRRLLLADGKPFIPTAIDWEGSLTPEIMAYLGRHGINTILGHAYGLRGADGVAKVRALLDQAQAAGVRLIIGCNAGDKEMETTRALVRRLNDHPALLAWDIFDEVFTVPWGQANYDTVAARCRELRELSPYRPVYLNENAWGLSYLKSKRLDFPGEVVSIDHYAYPPSGDLPVTLRYVRMMEEMGRAEGKPVFLFVLGAGYAFGASRDHTPAEQEYLAYGALIHGARAILYFASHPKSRSSWERIQGICREVKELTPVLAAPGEPERVACSAASISLLAKRAAGKLYLIAVNNAKTPVKARFDLAALAGTTRSRVEALFEGRHLSLKTGGIEEEFAGFARHVYVVTLPKAAR